MKKSIILSVILCGIISFFAFQDDPKVQAEITNWFNNKKACVVFTFDDWSPGHGSIVYPLFKKHELPCTFYVTLKNKDYCGGYSTMKNAFNDGFEIGNHTSTHPDLSSVDSIELINEIVETQRILRENVHPNCANTFAYPFGVFNKDVLTLTHKTHIGARLATLRYGRKWPYTLTFGKTNYYQLQTFMSRDIYTPSTFEKLVEQAKNQGGMITFMYHSIYNDSIKDNWFGAISEDLLEAQLLAVKKHQKNVWITTFENAIKYHKAKKTVRVTTQQKINEVRISIDAQLDTLKFNQPLTIKINGIAHQKDLKIFEEATQQELEYFVDSNNIYCNIMPRSQHLFIKL